jgi:hypothetical protein
MEEVGFRDIMRFDYNYVNKERYQFSEGMLYIIGRK